MSTRAGGAGHPVAGVIIPLVTALNDRGEPDAMAARPLLAHLAAGGVTTLMLAGTNGEGPALAPAAVRAYTIDCAALWRDLAGPSAQVLVTAAGAGTEESLRRL